MQLVFVPIIVDKADIHKKNNTDHFLNCKLPRPSQI